MKRARTPRIIDFLVSLNMVIAGLAIIAMLVHVVLDVAMREFFHSPFSGTLEIVSYWYMVGLVFLAIPAAQANGEHIQVELFTTGLSPRWRAAMDIVVLLGASALLFIFTWVSFEEALRQTASWARVEAGTGMIIVWPTRWLVPASMASTALICLVQAGGIARHLFTGEPLLDDEGHSDV